MVRKRRYSRRKRSYRRKRYGYRKGNRRMSRGKQAVRSNLIHVYRQTPPQNTAVSISGGSGNGFFSYFFQLSDVPGAAEYTTAFDQYRINMIVFKFMPLTNDYPAPTTTAGIPTANIPTIIIAKDYTDSTTPTTVASVTEYGNARTYQFNRPIHIKLRPACLRSVFTSGGGNISANPAYRQWLDTSAPTVAHFGLKGCVTSLPATPTAFYMKIQAKYYLSLKNIR